jgi:general secretion pathway protein E
MNAPITRARECDMSFTRLIAVAHDRRASDIHLDPFGRLSFRESGRIVSTELNSDVQPDEITREATRLAGLAPGRPGRGRFVVAVSDRDVDVIASILPTIDGDHLNLRLYDTGLMRLDLEEMDLLPEQLAGLKEAVASPYGLVLTGGPTGSGKTTLLYGLLNEANGSDKVAISIEDPVGFRLPGVVQTEVGPNTPFAALFDSALAHDPDIIMIGGIVDRATAGGAVRAALSGHLVLSAVHAGDTADIVGRLLSTGVLPHALSEALVSVTAMRLVPRTDAGETGKRRTAFFEALVMTPQLRAVLSETGSAAKLHDAAVKTGMKTLKETGAMLVEQGIAKEQDVQAQLNR